MVELSGWSNNLLDARTMKSANEMNNLSRRFCVAPMMDWSENTISSVA
jgi:hypothetical protein